MTKIKNSIIVVIAFVLIYACSESNPLIDNFDHSGQALKDSDTLIKYLSNHYYDAGVDSIKPIATGKTALINDPNLKSQDVTEQEINYKLYYYVINQGIPNPTKGYPTQTDSILTKYTGSQITDTNFIEVFESQNAAVWFTLDAVVRGWSYGFTHFKGGENITNNGPITYQDTGKGFLFIPSGLAYRNSSGGSITPNSCLIFRFELMDIVENTDHDNDGLASYLELDGANTETDPRKVDSDGDGIPNYKDTDDDNDGVPTIKEDANKDGDPRNDFSDPNNPTIPDYLNPKIK
jgi:FKBP-type peptidyl-prolyl cis-trans isomerase FkpA